MEPSDKEAAKETTKETAGKGAVSVPSGKQASDAKKLSPVPAPEVKQKLTSAPVASVVSRTQIMQSAAAQAPSQQPIQTAVTATPINDLGSSSPAPSREAPRRIPINAPRATPAQDKTAAAAVIASFFLAIVIALALAYLYFSLCLFLIARKLNVPAPWVAWVPIAQVWTMVTAAGKPGWWVLLFLIPVVNFILHIYLWMCIVENLGRKKWLGLLMAVPVVNFVYLGMLAFSHSDSSSSAA